MRCSLKRCPKPVSTIEITSGVILLVKSARVLGGSEKSVLKVISWLLICGLDQKDHRMPDLAQAISLSSQEKLLATHQSGNPRGRALFIRAHTDARALDGPHFAIGLSRIRSSKSLICSPSKLSFRPSP